MAKKTQKKKADRNTSGRKQIPKTLSYILPCIIFVAILIIIGGKTSMEIVEDGSKVKVHYTGKLQDGSVFDSSEGKDPLEFVIGAGQMIKGFEEGVMGMKVGEKKTIEIPADKAYGQRDESRTGEYPRENIPEGTTLSVGAKMVLKSPDGNVGIAVIKEIKDDVVVLDLNHPLAGQDLIFEIEVVSIEKA